MKSFVVTILPRAFNDIQDAVYYYESLNDGLGEKFFDEVDAYMQILGKHPFYQVRYDDVRCLPLKKFPYMIHFRVDEIQKVVYVEAVVNCYQNPGTSWLVNEP
ncbi:MAG: hypothetical protein RLZZ367_1591 [Bacteroidota bacterium]|jgi:hypothetical protein